MNTQDYLVSSDVASGITAAVLEKVNGHVSNEKIWRPFVENTVLSILGRMGQSYLSGKTFSSAGTEAKPGTPYIRTAQGRSSLIIYISDMIIQYVMKNKNKYSHSLLAVASDTLGNEIVGALMTTDTVLIAKKV
jgi:hypothetical protein